MEANVARKSIQRALANLTQVELDQFRTELVNRPVEPRVLRNRVEKKTEYELAEVMVAAFTGRVAVLVAMELLDEMGLTQNAKDLATEAAGRGLPL
ncbi:apoptosis-associated speck-like protein containing a CARD [Menidia menidia]